jgi:hypothetical protein
VHVIIEDHISPDLLFCGTEFGVFVSTDGGGRWTQMKAGVPTIAVRDLAIQRRENDLVLGTFGRGFYVLDDYSPLRSLAKGILDSTATLLPARDALMYVQTRARARGAQGETFFAAPNPPFGATLTIYLKDAPKTRKQQRKADEKAAQRSYPDWDALRAEDQETEPWLLLAILDAEGNEIRRLRAPATTGFQRVTWDLRYASMNPVTATSNLNAAAGMPVMPGHYQAMLSLVTDGVETPLTGPVSFLARVLESTTLPTADRAALVAFQRDVAATQRSVLAVQRFTDELRDRFAAIENAVLIAPSADNSLRDAVLDVRKEMLALQIQIHGDPTISSRHGSQPPSLLHRMQRLIGEQWASTSAPTAKHRGDLEQVRHMLDPILDTIRHLATISFPDIERRLDAIGAPWTPGRLPLLDMEAR